MALTCGFYDSLNGDRKYNAYQMSSLFDGLISDGVYAGIGTGFAVTVTSGMNIAVDSGRAWFDHTWTYNGSKYTMTLEAADALRDRIDAVVLEINSSTAARTNTLAIVKGTAATNPVRPTLSKSGTKKQYALAYIRVKAGATSLSQADITYVVGTGETPYVTGVLQSVGIDAQVAQWNAEFNEWFENLKAQLSGNIATNLQNQITALANRTTKIEADYKHLIKLKEFTVSTSGSKIATMDVSDISFAEYAQVYIDVLAFSDYEKATNFYLYFNDAGGSQSVYWKLGASYGEGGTLADIFANAAGTTNPVWTDRIVLQVGKQGKRRIRAISSDGCGKNDALTYSELKTLSVCAGPTTSIEVKAGTRVVLWGEK